MAKNRLQGDHTASSILEGRVVATVLVPHETRSPCTILTKGEVCGSYSSRTIDSLGANTSAE